MTDVLKACATKMFAWNYKALILKKEGPRGNSLEERK